MIIPIRTEIARRRPTVITYWIMSVCVVVFLVTTILEHRAPDLYFRIFSFGALHGDFRPDMESIARQLERTKSTDIDPLGLLTKLRMGAINPARWWQFITYQFMHAGWMHLLGNMVVLWVFGPVVEDRVRRWWFLAFYLVGGAFAGFVHGLFEGRVLEFGATSGLFYVPVIGASGSIAAVTGAFLVLFPQSRIDIIWFLGIIGRFSIPAWWFVGMAIAWDFISTARGSGGVANIAHIGGYVFGASVAMVCLWRRWIPREPFNLFTMSKQAHRRRAYRELMHKPAAGTGTGPDHSVERAAIFDAIRAGNIGLAADRYSALLESGPDEILPRDSQLAIANHWFATGRHTHAAAAYEAFLKRYPDDRERAATALMLALVSARYLNDPVKAAALLAELPDAKLSEEHRALADALRKEIA